MPLSGELTTKRSPATAGEYCRRLLTKHLTTIEKLRDDIRARRSDPSLNELPRDIPVPLYPGETLQSYTQKFEHWLAQRGGRLSAMEGDPSQERSLWFSFAYLRAQTSAAMPVVYDKKRPAPSEDAMLYGNKRPRRDNVSDTVVIARTRDELLARRVLTPEEYLHEVMDRRPTRTAAYEPQQKLQEVPVLLYPGQTMHTYEEEFRLWLSQRRETMASLRTDPSTERAYRFQFALSKATKSSGKTRAGDVAGAKAGTSVHSTSASPAECTRLMVVESGEQESKAASSPETLPSWAASIIDRVQDLEAQVTTLQREAEVYRNATCTPRAVNRELPHDEKNGLSAKASDDTEVLPIPSARPFRSHSSAVTAPYESGGVAAINAVTKSTLARPAAPVSPAPVDPGLKKRQLVKEYIHLHDVITTNETAINDALEYVRTIKEVDEAQAVETQREITKLVLEICQKKEQRSAALAALITCSWTVQEGAMMSLLDESTALTTGKSCVTHEGLAKVLLQMEKKSTAIDDLGTEAQLMKVQPPPNTKFSAILRKHMKIQELSGRLTKEETAKEELEKECRQMMKSFLQTDADVRGLVRSSLV